MSYPPGTAVLFGVWLTAIASPAAPYSVIDLGPISNPPGQTESRPNGINRTGVIAAANASGGVYQALVYDGTWSNLGTLGGLEAYAAGINNGNRVVGFSTIGSGSRRAFLWTPGGTDGIAGNLQMKSLGTLGGDASEAYAINESGQITGYSQTTGRDHAFRYSGGVMTDIGTLISGSLHSYGFDINDGGRVAGTAYNNSYSTSTAFYYNGGSIQKIPAWQNGSSTALALSNSDRIAGYATAAGGTDHAFRYYSGVLTDLGTLGGNYSYAVGINNSNAVVGGAFTDLNDTIYHAFLATGDTMTDLNTQLDATGAGWTLIEARAINDVGQIVGLGRRNSSNRAFLLNPIVPPPPQPQITSLRFTGSAALVSFTTSATARYYLESRTVLGAAVWTNATPALAGSGGVITATNVGGQLSTSRYFRIRAVAP